MQIVYNYSLTSQSQSCYSTSDYSTAIGTARKFILIAFILYKPQIPSADIRQTIKLQPTLPTNWIMNNQKKYSTARNYTYAAKKSLFGTVNTNCVEMLLSLLFRKAAGHISKIRTKERKCHESTSRYFKPTPSWRPRVRKHYTRMSHKPKNLHYLTHLRAY